jgi:hypothetical protein
MQASTFQREYQISFGEFGGWRQGLPPSVVQGAKRRVHDEVTDLFRGVEMPWILDLDTVLIANGIFADPREHLTISEEVHVRVLQGWLSGLRPQLRNADRLWIDAARARGLADVRCCTFPGNGWRACDVLRVLRGETLRAARPWTVKVPGNARLIEISVQVSWPCALAARTTRRTKQQVRAGRILPQG